MLAKAIKHIAENTLSKTVVLSEKTIGNIVRLNANNFPAGD